MKLFPSIALCLGSIVSALPAQNILNQFSIAYNYEVTVPFFSQAQFNAPDGSGGLIQFDLKDDSLSRFDSTGKQLWSTTLNLGSASGVVATMAVVADGILLGGQVNGALPGQTGAGSYDAFVIKYDLNGNSLWTTQFGTSGGDYTRDIAPAPNGFYVLGVTTEPQGLFIRSSDSQGHELWTRRFVDSALIDIIGGTADSTGVYFFGQPYNVVRKFDSAGNDSWSHIFARASIVTGVAADGQGVYAVYIDNGPSSSVTRLDLSGTEVWTRLVPEPSYVSDSIATDGTGFYIYAGAERALPGQCYAGGGDIFVTRFDPAANPLWSREFGTAGSERPAQLSIGGSAIYLSGFAGAGNVSLTTIEKSSAAPPAGQPAIFNECVLNAANYLGGAVAPGEIITVLGAALGPQDVVKLQPSADGRTPPNSAGPKSCSMVSRRR